MDIGYELKTIHNFLYLNFKECFVYLQDEDWGNAKMKDVSCLKKAFECFKILFFILVHESVFSIFLILMTRSKVWQSDLFIQSAAMMKA